jgi:hypothetical protein
MLLRTEKMDVEFPAALGGVAAAVCIVDDDPSSKGLAKKAVAPF